MPINVEIGLGDAEANSYVSAQEVTDYWTAREDYTYISEGNIIRAAQALDMYYANSYLSERITLEQGLEWPRNLFIDNNGFTRDAGEIPKEVKTAQIELAMMAANGYPLIQVNTDQSNVQSESVNVGKGAVSESKSYFSPGTVNETSSVASFLTPILNKYYGSSNGVRIK